MKAEWDFQRVSSSFNKKNLLTGKRKKKCKFNSLSNRARRSAEVPDSVITLSEPSQQPLGELRAY